MDEAESKTVFRIAVLHEGNYMKAYLLPPECAPDKVIELLKQGHNPFRNAKAVLLASVNIPLCELEPGIYPVFLELVNTIANAIGSQYGADCEQEETTGEKPIDPNHMRYN